MFPPPRALSRLASPLGSSACETPAILGGSTSFPRRRFHGPSLHGGLPSPTRRGNLIHISFLRCRSRKSRESGREKPIGSDILCIVTAALPLKGFSTPCDGLKLRRIGRSLLPLGAIFSMLLHDLQKVEAPKPVGFGASFRFPALHPSKGGSLTCSPKTWPPFAGRAAGAAAGVRFRTPR